MALYILWLKRRMPQFESLLDGIIRIGQGDLETREFVPTSIIEFQRMQQEINKTSQALREQMDTIRQMEREQMELENQKREQELIVRELSTARQIQESMLPHRTGVDCPGTEHSQTDPGKHASSHFPALSGSE